MNQVGVGIVGFGTVGAGVAEGLLLNRQTLSKRLGVDVALRKIADLDISTSRGFPVPSDLLTTNADELIADPSIQILVETVGGTTFAKDLILKALAAGKSVVTANKKLLAEQGREIFAAAREHGRDIYFGASVGGGIPIIRCLREGLVGNRIESICGILNGTCNYILTRMIREGAAFGDVLKDAQALGFAEADPTLDVDGWDTAHKACILAALAYDLAVSPREIEVHGIRDLSRVDVAYAHELGHTIKLLAHIARHGSEVEVAVSPTLVPNDHALSAVNGVFNAVMVRGDFSDELLFSGKGAGRRPTASTVIGDIADLARNLATGARARYTSAVPSLDEELALAKGSTSRFYARLMVADRCGALGQFGTIFGAHGVSIKCASSHEFLKGQERAGSIPVVVRTHEARACDMSAALDEIERAGIVCEKPVAMRMIG